MLKKKYSDEEDFDQVSYIDFRAVDFQEAIDNLYDNKPDKRKKEYKTWRCSMNRLIKEYNNKFGRMYSLIK